jgi:endoglucanase
MRRQRFWTVVLGSLAAIGAVLIGCGGSTDAVRAADDASALSSQGSSTKHSRAQVAPGVYRLRNACSGRYLGLRSGVSSPWAEPMLASSDAQQAARWQVVEAADGLVALQAAGSTSVLQTAWGKTAQGTAVDVWTDVQGNTQRWRADDMGEGAMRLTLAAAPAMALDARSAGKGSDRIGIEADNASCAQRWRFEPAGSAASSGDAFATQRKLGRGINFGNILEASPSEGSWGLSLSDELFDKAREAGFATIRLPVRWSNHAQLQAPYAIDTAFFERVDYAIRAATSRGMNIVVNMHHHRQLCGEKLDNGEPAVDASVLDDRFVAMWGQIAKRYQSQPPERVLFELYNEPNSDCTPARWNGLLQRALAEVRKTNPDRFVVVGPTSWNSADALEDLQLPDDRRLIVTIHNYNPFRFTHQGASWAGNEADNWLGTNCCDAAQTAEITAPLDRAQQWAGGRWPIWVGEFGAYEKAPYDARLRYMRLVRDEAEKRGFTWAYWEMASGFGIWDPMARAWRTDLRDALVGP